MELMAEKPDNYYDLCIVDPEYGIKESAHRNYSRSKLTKTKNYRKTVWDSDIPKQEYFDELFRVTKNQIIAFSGQTGSAQVPSLHFEIRKRGVPVDPLQYLE